MCVRGGGGNLQLSIHFQCVWHSLATSPFVFAEKCNIATTILTPFCDRGQMKISYTHHMLWVSIEQKKRRKKNQKIFQWNWAKNAKLRSESECREKTSKHWDFHTFFLYNVLFPVCRVVQSKKKRSELYFGIYTSRHTKKVEQSIIHNNRRRSSPALHNKE